jgi:hypothetical protein
VERVIAVISVCHIVNTDILISVYFAHFHSIIKYEIILWGNSSNSTKILTLQKKIVRLTAGVKPRNSCRSLFKRSEILTPPREFCIFSLLLLIVNNQELFSY